MIVIPPNRSIPFREQSLFRFQRPRPGVCHFSPDQQSQPVAPIQPARILDFLMLPRRVEPKLLRYLHIKPQRLVRGRREIRMHWLRDLPRARCFPRLGSGEIADLEPSLDEWQQAVI